MELNTGFSCPKCGPNWEIISATADEIMVLKSEDKAESIAREFLDYLSKRYSDYHNSMLDSVSKGEQDLFLLFEQGKSNTEVVIIKFKQILEKHGVKYE
jgi:hypothetical protein